MYLVFDHLREHDLKLKPSKCDLFKPEINYLAHHMSKERVHPSQKNVTSIVSVPPPKTYTDIRLFTGLIGHYRHLIRGYELSPEVSKAFDILKKECAQAPILSFLDFKKTFLLEAGALGKG